MLLCETQRGRIVDQRNQRHQRITRVNRSPNRLHFSAAVTDSPIPTLGELERVKIIHGGAYAVLDGDWSVFQFLLDQDATADVVNTRAGDLYTFVLRQDSVGGHHWTWPVRVDHGSSVLLTPYGMTVQTFVADQAGALHAIYGASWQTVTSRDWNEQGEDYWRRIQAAWRDGGVVPPWHPSQRILGFVIQLSEDDIDCERICLPHLGFFAPGDAAAITLNDRILAIAACDVCPGDKVIVEAFSGLPAAQGITVQGATWESDTMAGGVGVIQVNTRTAR